MPIKVRKKDGTLEDFNRNKVAGGMVKSGATPEEAESIASQIEAWAQSAAIDGIIDTSEIRIKLLELLRAVNPTAAAAFEAYQKSVVQEPVAQEPTE